jgi:hypothetical protein
LAADGLADRPADTGDVAGEMRALPFVRAAGEEGTFPGTVGMVDANVGTGLGEDLTAAVSCEVPHADSAMTSINPAPEVNLSCRE